jgi:hypothetical protein
MTKMKIVKKIENIYNTIIKKYIEKNNLQSHYVYYPLGNDKNIIVPRNDYTAIYFVASTTRLYLKFNEGGKLIHIAWLDEYDELPINLTYKDYIYAYKRLKELSVRLV